MKLTWQYPATGNGIIDPAEFQIVKDGVTVDRVPASARSWPIPPQSGHFADEYTVVAAGPNAASVASDLFIYAVVEYGKPFDLKVVPD